VGNPHAICTPRALSVQSPPRIFGTVTLRLRAWRIGALAVLGGAVIVALLWLVPGAHTPTTTAYVQNDTGAAGTLDNCADTAVTVIPGSREQVNPFQDPARSACVVYGGGSDLGKPIGCLHFPELHGRTAAGAVVRISAMRRGSSSSRCR